MVPAGDAHAGSAHARRRAALTRLAGVSAERTVRTLAWLARECTGDALLVAELACDPVGLLGLFQPPGSSREARELRGCCGGRSGRLASGVLLACARVEAPGEWLGEPAEALSGARLLNRLVRGLLAGLTPFGVGASYPGRDFVVARGRRVAQLALGRDARGALLFQALLGVTRACFGDEPDAVFPGLPVPPPPGVLELAPEALASALARGFGERFGLELEPGTAGEAEPPPLADPELAGLSSAGALAIPIGELRAHVALGADGALARVRLRGDFMAAPAPLRALEDALAGLAPAGAAVAERCARWLAAPESGVVGVTDPGALALAIARSATHSSL